MDSSLLSFHFLEFRLQLVKFCRVAAFDEYAEAFWLVFVNGLLNLFNVVELAERAVSRFKLIANEPHLFDI